MQKFRWHRLLGLFHGAQDGSLYHLFCPCDRLHLSRQTTHCELMIMSYKPPANHENAGWHPGGGARAGTEARPTKDKTFFLVEQAF